MIIPPPERGQVIFYTFLWPYEAAKGQENGVKERPCLIVSALPTRSGKTRVAALPITHAPPKNRHDAIELPPDVKKALKLDAKPSWVWLRAANVFKWPPVNLCEVPNRKPATSLLGKAPYGFMGEVQKRYTALLEANQITQVARTDNTGAQRSFRLNKPKQA